VGSAAFQKTVGKTNIRPANIKSCLAFVLNKQVQSYQPVRVWISRLLKC